MNNQSRRGLLNSLGAALTFSILDDRAKGANDRVTIGFIGVGSMGSGNLKYAMNTPGFEVAAVCEVYQPRLDAAVHATGGRARAIADFREILADNSIDAVCISTPDHWHAYMMIEACKAGKDVYVEKPIATSIGEGALMVTAARKYQRVVQVGTIQRSGFHFQKAVQIVKSGRLGKITFCRTWTYRNFGEEGIGNPPDGEPPKDLNWDLWLGPAPRVPFNQNRFFGGKFRYFWDYAGGRLTDWGVHLIDTIQWAFDNAAPQSAVALGHRFCCRDFRDTPDTLEVIWQYPEFLMIYENRDCTETRILNNQGYGMAFQGTKGTLVVDRTRFRIVPEAKSGLEPVEVKSTNDSYVEHWTNFLECIKSRKRPVSDIDIAHHSTTTAHLGNVALRSGNRVDWDRQSGTVRQAEALKYLTREYRAPWSLEV